MSPKKTKQKVFIVVAGEVGEGGTVVGAFRTAYEASKAALEVEHAFGPWQLAGDPSAMKWVSGCDFVEVQEVELK